MARRALPMIVCVAMGCSHESSDAPTDAAVDLALDDVALRCTDTDAATAVYCTPDGASYAWSSIEPPVEVDPVIGLARARDDVWIAGTDGTSPIGALERGGYAHWDGACWGVLPPSPTTSAGFWPRNAGDVWSLGATVGANPASSYSAKVWHFDGATWATWPGLTDDEWMEHLWPSAHADVAWMIGAKLTFVDGSWSPHDRFFLRWSEGAWARVDAPADEVVDFVPLASDDLWMVTADASASISAIQHGDGTTWSTVPPSPTGCRGPFWPVTIDDVWMGCEDGMAHFDGATWTKMAVAFPQGPTAIWGAGPSDVWVSTYWNDEHSPDPEGSPFAHWDGASWSTSCKMKDVYALFGGSSDDVWALSLYGPRLLHYGPSLPRR